MSYIDRSLGEGERIIARAHFHWLYDVVSWAALVIAMAVAVSVFITFQDLNREALTIADAVVFAAGLTVFLERMIRKWTTEIGVTSHRLVKKAGWLSLKTNEIALLNIEGVRVMQSVWGRLWGYGQLRIEGTGVDAVTLPPIADPIGFRRAIETAKGIRG
jgi:hypothetical protein